MTRWPGRSPSQELQVAFAFSCNPNGIGQAVFGEPFLTRQRDCNAEQGARPVHL